MNTTDDHRAQPQSRRPHFGDSGRGGGHRQRHDGGQGVEFGGAQPISQRPDESGRLDQRQPCRAPQGQRAFPCTIGTDNTTTFGTHSPEVIKAISKDFLERKFQFPSGASQ
jgi:hypothetical protein